MNCFLLLLIYIYICARTVPLKESSAAEEVHMGEIFSSSTRNRTFYWSFNSAHKGLNKQESGKKVLKFCDIFIFLLLYSSFNSIGTTRKEIGSDVLLYRCKGTVQEIFCL
jgi:hypothetical protein